MTQCLKYDRITFDYNFKEQIEDMKLLVYQNSSQKNFSFGNSEFNLVMDDNQEQFV